MNRISVKDNIISLDDCQDIFADGNNIVVNDNTELIITNSNLTCRMELNIIIEEDKNVKINIVNKGNDYNIKYNYTLNKNSNLEINKFNYVNDIKEDININLNGEKAYIDYNFKTISNGTENYNMNIYHNYKNTNSNITNNGVNNKGFINFIVSCYIKQGIKGCVSNQNNRIINLCDNTCMIRPNLFIDEFDVIANHSALIGTFSKDEIFYLESRGISYNDSIKLLTKGFLLSKIDNKEVYEEINKVIE